MIMRCFIGDAAERFLNHSKNILILETARHSTLQMSLLAALQGPVRYVELCSEELWPSD